MITAIVLIQAETDRIPEVAEAIADLDGVSEVYSVTGEVDLIAMVRVRGTRSSPTSSPTGSARSTACGARRPTSRSAPTPSTTWRPAFALGLDDV